MRGKSSSRGKVPAGIASMSQVQKMGFLQATVDDLKHRDKSTRLDSATKLRKILSMELNPPIQEVIDCGAVPIFVDMLRPGSSDSVHPSIQFESAWALTNIASGTSAHTATVIDSGAIPVFVSLLTLSNNCDVREQAAWALGNIAGDSPRCRDLVLNANALKPLLLQLKKAGSTFQMTTSTSELSMLRNTAWTLSNLCRGKPQPELSQVKPALAPLAELISSTDPEMSADACWALCYLSDGANDRIQAVIEAGVCKRLVELLNHPSASVQTPALRCVGNVATGDDGQTQVVIDCGLLPILLSLLHNVRVLAQS